MIYQMCIFRVEPYDPPRLFGALFSLVCLLFFLKPKNNNHFWAMLFVCFCSAVSLKHPPQRVPKTLTTRLFFLSVFGWFFLFVFKIKHHTKSKETKKKLTTPEYMQRLSLQKSQSVGLLTLQSWILSPKMLNGSPLAYRVTEHFGGGEGFKLTPHLSPLFWGGLGV